MIATITVLWLLGIVPAFVVLRAEEPANKHLWWAIPIVFIWPIALYLAMLALAVVYLWNRVRGR